MSDPVSDLGLGQESDLVSDLGSGQEPDLGLDAVLSQTHGAADYGWTPPVRHNECQASECCLVLLAQHSEQWLCSLQEAGSCAGEICDVILLFLQACNLLLDLRDVATTDWLFWSRAPPARGRGS